MTLFKQTPRGEVLSAIRTWQLGGRNLLDPHEHLELLDERDSLRAALEDQFTGERDPRNIAKLKEALAVAMRVADELQAECDASAEILERASANLNRVTQQRDELLSAIAKSRGA